MVDTGDLKSLARKGVRVQVPPRAPSLWTKSVIIGGCFVWSFFGLCPLGIPVRPGTVAP